MDQKNTMWTDINNADIQNNRKGLTTMEYTPQVLRTLELPRPANKKAAAYDADSVDTVLENLANQVEELYDANTAFEEQNKEVIEKLEEVSNELAEIEAAGGPEKAAEVTESVSLLATAQEVATAHVKEAEAIVTEANEVSLRLRNEAAEEAASVRAEADDAAARTVAEAQVEADELSGEARDLVTNAAERAQERVDEILSEGIARRDALAVEIENKQAELSRLNEQHRAKLAEFKRLVRDTLVAELDADDETLAPAATVASKVEEEDTLDLDFSEAKEEEPTGDLFPLDEDEDTRE